MVGIVRDRIILEPGYIEVWSASLNGNIFDIEFELLKIERKLTWGKVFDNDLTTSEFNCLFRKPDMNGTLRWIIYLETVDMAEIGL